MFLKTIELDIFSLLLFPKKTKKQSKKNNIKQLLDFISDIRLFFWQKAKNNYVEGNLDTIDSVRRVLNNLRPRAKRFQANPTNE